MSQIGGLLTAQGKAAEGVPYNLAALSSRAAIGSREVRTDLYLLGQQRDQLGDHHFDTLLTDHLDKDSKRVVLQALAPTQPPSELPQQAPPKCTGGPHLPAPPEILRLLARQRQRQLNRIIRQRR